jgi:serine/threonine protein kinase
MRQFDREIGVQSMVVHPNLARVLERGRDENSCYFVVEYLPGGDVNRLVSKVYNGPVDPELVARIGLQILSGLIALHEHGFVHRDLKPPNFLLSKAYDDPMMSAKITDYGLAKSFEEAGNSMFDLTRGGEVAGSMMYMPPEQILDYRFVRPPTDVYAVGVSLYFLLTAKYTVDFPTTIKKYMANPGRPQRNPIQAILDDPPIPLIERHSAVPRRLAEVVDRAVQKDVEKRYQTAEAFRADLREAYRIEGLR